MRSVWLSADSIVSPLGLTTSENYAQVRAGTSGIARKNFSGQSVCVAHLENIKRMDETTRFESISRVALQALSRQVTLPSHRTLFVLSTTKGNIEVLEQDNLRHPRIHLHAVAQQLAKELDIENSLVISNACTSGVVALLHARRYIEQGKIDHAIVLGADTVNRFVLSGFRSLNAMSDDFCRPFDAQRSGINLGEAAAAVLLTAKPEEFGNPKIRLRGGGISNDANHISGPSKTGEELAMAIIGALKETGVESKDIGFVSAHGTATLYNDEMEAKAFHLVNLSDTPLHSLKGNFGHTLGAAGVVETVLSAQSLLRQELLPSYGFEKKGVSQNINVIKNPESRQMRFALKTASGFGGCNAALVLSFGE